MVSRPHVLFYVMFNVWKSCGNDEMIRKGSTQRDGGGGEWNLDGQLGGQIRGKWGRARTEPRPLKDPAGKGHRAGLRARAKTGQGRVCGLLHCDWAGPAGSRPWGSSCLGLHHNFHFPDSNTGTQALAHTLTRTST